MLSNHVTRFSLSISLTSKNSDTLSRYAEIDSFSGLNSPTWQNVEFNPILVANCSVLENDSTRFNNHFINVIHICTNWNNMLYACVPHYTTNCFSELFLWVFLITFCNPRELVVNSCKFNDPLSIFSLYPQTAYKHSPHHLPLILSHHHTMIVL